MMYELLFFAIGVATGSIIVLSILLVVSDVKEMRNARERMDPADADLVGPGPDGDRVGV